MFNEHDRILFIHTKILQHTVKPLKMTPIFEKDHQLQSVLISTSSNLRKRGLTLYPDFLKKPLWKQVVQLKYDNVHRECATANIRDACLIKV